MKKQLTVLAIGAFMVACKSTTRNESAKLENDAMKQATATIKELAKHPESSKTSDFRTVYATDSLCILHFNHTGKNGFGNEITTQMEYIYLLRNDKIYEAVHEANRDSVYLNPETMEKEQRMTIYAGLPYDQALMYRVVKSLNEEGRVVGKKGEAVDLPIPTGTGNWELKYYTDDFGDLTPDRYLVLYGRGTFSNSATTNSNMSAYLFVDKTGISMRLVEYSSSVVKDNDYCSLKVKDSDGIIYNWGLYNTRSGYMYFSGNAKNDMYEILNKGGEVSLHGTMGRYVISDYTFKFDVTGYEKAAKLL